MIGRRTLAVAVTAAAALGGSAAAMGTANAATPASMHKSMHCDTRQHWTLSGRNTVEAVYQGSTFSYPAKFFQSRTFLGGKLTDPYYPTTGPIAGQVKGNCVTFAFRYPKGSVQGTRTYDGTISRHGRVSGTWSQTGSQGGGGTWTLALPAHLSR